MAKIYISSTFEDLKDYRKAVYHVLQQLGHTVIAMEDYVASDKRPLQKCLEDVGSCDIYIGLFAWRYGFIPPNHSQSITELEYLHATKNNIDRLIFILDENAPWSPHFVDTDRTRIEHFKNQLMLNHMVEKFKTPDDLKSCVSVSMQHIQKSSDTSCQQKPLQTIDDTCQQKLLQTIDDEILFFLPYYVNRTKQLTDMQDKCENTPNKHTFWVIPGAINQCHFEFLKCIENWHWKEKFNWPLNQPPKLINFEITTKLHNLDAHIFNQLWKKLNFDIKYKTDTHKQLCIDRLYEINQCHTIVLHTSISIDTWKSNQSNLLPGLLSFIDQFPKRKNDLVLCVLLTYPVGSFFKNRLKNTIIKSIQKQYPDLIIEELGNVDETDVKKWLTCDLFKQFCGYCDTKCSSDIYKSNHQTSIPMEELTVKLRERFIDKQKN